jgi:membrane protein YdbS with pleckstrin-like domain
LTIPCIVNAVACYVNAVACYVNAVTCYVNAMACYVNAIACYVNAVTCYVNAVPIQMRYKIRSPDVGARQCRALTGVPHVNENRYNAVTCYRITI